MQLRHIGRLERLAPALQEKVHAAIELTRNNDRLVLIVAFNYGGRDEIVQAIQRIMKDGIPADQVTSELVSQYLYTAGVPDPDLIIRTSGELRVSNFLIWQGAYAELYSTPTYLARLRQGRVPARARHLRASRSPLRRSIGGSSQQEPWLGAPSPQRSCLLWCCLPSTWGNSLSRARGRVCRNRGLGVRLHVPP